MIRISSIRARLILIILVLVVTPMVFLAFTLFSIVSGELRLRLVAEKELAIKEEALILEATFEAQRSLLRAMRDLPPVQGMIRSRTTGIDPLDGSTYTQWVNRFETIFNSIIRSDRHIFQLRYMDENGLELVNAKQKADGTIQIVPVKELQDKSQELYFIESKDLQLNEVYTSTLNLNRENGEVEVPYRPTVRLITPVFDERNNERKGSIVINLGIAPIIDLVERTEENVILVDQDGYFLFHPDASKRFGRQLAHQHNFFTEQPELTLNTKEQDFRSQYDPEESHFRIWRKFFVDESNTERYWIVFFVIDEEELLFPVRNLRSVTIMIVLIVSAICILIGYAIAGKIADPIILLTKSATSIAEGDLSAAIPRVKSDDQIGMLATAFSNMQTKLIGLYESLEQQVQKRTQDLQEALSGEKKTKEAMLNIMEDFEEAQTKLKEEIANTKKFQMAVDRSGDAIVITDTNRRIIYVNEAWCTLTGYKSEEVLNVHVDFVDAEETPADIQHQLHSSVQAEKPFFSQDVIIKRKNRSTYFAEFMMYPIASESKVLFWVELHRDITARKKEDTAKKEFISLASHQLRTPLTTIKWVFDMFNKGKAGTLDDFQKELLADAQTCARHMSESIGTMLTVSRIEAGKVRMKFANTSVCSIIDDIHTEQKVSIEEKGVSCDIECDKSIELTTDRALLSEVIRNLFSNAVKYSPKKASVSVRATQKNDSIVIDITDTGMGIPKHQQKKIFSKFFRADNALTSETEGTGLGLYLVYSLVGMLGGSISFTSEESKGTTFTLTLPLTHPDYEQ